MKIDAFKNPNIYSSIFYYLRGTWNAIPDVNTLIDVGTNDYVLECIKNLNPGVGKKKVDLVILTHEHFDHVGGLKYVIQEYSPKVMAMKKIPYVTDLLEDGMKLKIADTNAEIIHAPAHSNDSVCIYFEEKETIFVGDMPYHIKNTDGSYSYTFVELFEKICELKITNLYSGHDAPILENAGALLKRSFENLKNSKIF